MFYHVVNAKYSLVNSDRLMLNIELIHVRHSYSVFMVHHYNIDLYAQGVSLALMSLHRSSRPSASVHSSLWASSSSSWVITESIVLIASKIGQQGLSLEGEDGKKSV